MCDSATVVLTRCFKLLSFFTIISAVDDITVFSGERRRLPGGGRRRAGAQQHSSVVEAPARSGCNGGVGVVSRQDALDLPRQIYVGSLQVVQSVVEPLNNLQSAKPISYFTNAQQSTYMIRTNLYSAKNRENESKRPHSMTRR